MSSHHRGSFPKNRTMSISCMVRITLLASMAAIDWQGLTRNAAATSYTWNVDADGNWTDTTKWTPTGSPNAIDDVANLAGTTNLTADRTVTLPSGTITVGAINLGDQGDQSNGFSISGAGTSSTTLIFDVTSGNATLVKAGGGASNNVGNGTAASSFTIQVNDNLNILNSVGASTFTIFAPITGSGGVNLTASAARIDLRSPSALTYQGDTTINSAASHVRMRTANILPNGANRGNLGINAGGTLDMNGLSQSINGLSGSGTVDNTVNTAATLTVGNNNATSVFSGVIKNSGGTSNFLALTKTGTGTLTLSGVNIYGGGTNLNGGILNLGVAQGGGGGPLGGTGAVDATIGTISFGGGTLQYSAANQTDYSARFSQASGQAYKIDTNGQDVNWGTGRTPTGTGTLTKLGAGTLNVTATSNGWTGATNIDGGTLQVAGLAAINTNSSIGKGSAGGSAADLVFGGGTLKYTGASATATNRLFTIGDAAGLTATLDSSSVTAANTMSFTGTGALGFGGSGARSLTLTGTNTGTNTLASIIGDGTGGETSVNKTGAGTWLLSGANTYTGNTTVSAGTLILAAASTNNIPNSPIIEVNGTLDVLGYVLKRSNELVS